MSEIEMLRQPRVTCVTWHLTTKDAKWFPWTE